jgi:hypothetical protein
MDHLTSFASGYFPTPNLIDFQFIYSDFTLKVPYCTYSHYCTLYIVRAVHITNLRIQTAVSSKSGTGSRPEKFVQNLSFLMLEATSFPRKLASNFGFLKTFLTFVFNFFLLDTDPNPVPEQELDLEPESEFILVTVPLRQNVSVPVSQHCPEVT